jgi:hypothetical protein
MVEYGIEDRVTRPSFVIIRRVTILLELLIPSSDIQAFSKSSSVDVHRRSAFRNIRRRSSASMRLGRRRRRRRRRRSVNSPPQDPKPASRERCHAMQCNIIRYPTPPHASTKKNSPSVTRFMSSFNGVPTKYIQPACSTCRVTMNARETLPPWNRFWRQPACLYKNSRA